MPTISTFLMSLLSKAGLEFYSDLSLEERRDAQAREVVYAAMRQALVKEQHFPEQWFDDAVSRADELIEEKTRQTTGQK